MLELNYRDSRPIYVQIREGIRKLILSGVLQEGERLPSVRELSLELAINPNTVARAYRELEAAGCVYTVAAKGVFVAPAQPVREEQLTLLRGKLRELVEELLAFGLTPEEIEKETEACFHA